VTKTRTEISTKRNSGFSTRCRKLRRRNIDLEEAEVEKVKAKLHHQSGSGIRSQTLQEKWDTIFSEILLLKLARKMESHHHLKPSLINTSTVQTRTVTECLIKMNSGPSTLWLPKKILVITDKAIK
jgi:hypothetical protein